MEIFDIIKSVIFGIVEGITEWLPISSTGHMILLNEILPLRIGKNADDFYSMFEVVIQLGAILAVVVLFWSQIWQLLSEFFLMMYSRDCFTISRQ